MYVPYFICFVLSVLLCVNGVDSEATFKLVLERIEVTDVHPDYVQAKIWTYRFNRSVSAVSGWFKFLKTTPQDTVVVMQAFEFLSNRYKPYAIYGKRNLCHYLPNEYKNFFYPGMPNMFPPKCPLEPGNYSFSDYRPHTEVFPPTLPFNKMKFEIKFTTSKIVMFNLQTYVTFDRDVIIRERYG